MQTIKLDAVENELPPLLNEPIPIEETPHWRTKLEFVELIVKIGAVFAFIGYVALRAHVNSLGIPFHDSVSSQRYLMETWSWTVTSFFPLVKPACCLGLLGWLVAVLGRKWLQKSIKVRAHWAKIRECLVDKLGNGEDFFLAVLILTCVTASLMIELGSDVPLTLTGTLKQIVPRFETGSLYHMLVVIWIVQSAFWLARSAPGSSQRRPVALILLAVVTMQLPMIYGWLVLEQQCPIVTLQVKSEPGKESGSWLLVFETAERFIVWRTTGGKGEVTSYLRSEILNISAGETFSLREMIGKAAAAPALNWPAAALEIPRSTRIPPPTVSKP